MGTFDEIKQMQGEGKSDAEIMQTLRQRGFPDAEILDGLERAKIKSAVSSNSAGEPLNLQPSAAPAQNEFGTQEVVGGSSFSEGGYGSVQEYGDMQPSIMAPDAAPQQNYNSQQFQQQEYGNYPAYQSYQESASSDVIEEISEQVVTEKLTLLKDKIEKILDFRTTADARISSLNERLVRIEKILDRLQLSILQRMGEYVTDVKDIKNELEETQKSFKTLLHERHKVQHHPAQHSMHHEHPHSHHKKHTP